MEMINTREQSAHYYKMAGYAVELNNYRDSRTYICDAAFEIADGAASIYYHDIAKFISGHVDEVSDTIQKFGWECCGGDLYKAGQITECRAIEDEIHERLEEGLLVCAYDFLAHDLRIDEIPEDLNELIREWCADADCNDRMDEIPDKIREWLEEHGGECVRREN